MDQILSWTSLPNLHPALVHLPLGIMPMALLFEAAGLFRRRHNWPAAAAVVLYAAGALAALAALETGEDAADGLTGVPAEVQPHIGTHSDWAHYTAIALGILAALRIALAWWERREPRAGLRAVALLLALGCLALLLRTADLGGALVYRHALAVDVPASEAPETQAPTPPPDTSTDASSRLTRGDDGALRWRPVPEDGDALGTVLRAAEGFSGEAVTALESQGRGLELSADGRTLLVLPDDFGDVQVDATFELGSFTGTLGVAHHVRDASNAGSFTVSTEGVARLVDRRGGDENVLDESSVGLGGRTLELAVSSAGRHLKGLLAGSTVTHGHVEPGPKGSCGIILDGKGTLRVVSLDVTPLDSL